MRLGFFPSFLIQKIKKPTIWLHAVSVGEIISANSLLDNIRAKYPQHQLIISTITATGNEVARQIAGDKDLVIYLPYDLSFIVNRVIKRFSPLLFIILETEIWPNLINVLANRKIPLLIVNGRISQSSFKKYQRVKFLLSPLLQKVSSYCMQTKEDVQRIISLGAPDEKVKVSGNMKFDLQVSVSRYKKSDLGLKEQDILFIAASTHPGEEEIILEVYKGIDARKLRLLIAPRHIERAGEIGRLIQREKLTSQRFSNLNKTPQSATSNPQPVLLLDSVGELKSLLSIADIVFVGGSLIKKGGHNVLEPAFFGKPILFGRYMFNFKEIASLFLQGEGAMSVNDPDELKKAICDLLDDNKKRNELGRRAKQILEQNRGATQRNMEVIERFM
ncbi:MAG: 3-deoxy-D-manno-octulosonic acid transferase [Candidatus Omnitrophica bacterium]|nr:3-deoxy-D-manno-octulosonic acid transferase [Candidatus Omnitrophota bacterium]